LTDAALLFERIYLLQMSCRCCGVKLNVLTLGCPKNQADTNRLLGAAAGRGIEFVGDPSSADVIMVNTCGFIEEAKRESIDEILSIASLKRKGQKLLVFGCLAKRYAGELRAELPEVDAFFGVDADEAILNYIGAGARLTGGHGPSLEGLALRHTAPLKVADGCDRGCTFCVIPSIRGGFASRDPKEILSDAETLIKGGARELMLVAQDLTNYDFRGYVLRDLIRDLAGLEGEHWVRPMYFYPTTIDASLLEAMESSPSVCKYVDMPVQHSVDRILRAMGRAGGREDYLDRVNLIRAIMPGAALRTSVIVGFPGETDGEFDEMLSFLEEARFDWVGAFRYSPEEGTPAAGMEGQVEEDIKESRIDELMERQAAISAELNRRHVGKVMRALVDEVEAERSIARTEHQAPDIDGMTIVNAPGLVAGEFMYVRITASHEFDLEAEPL